jgi:DNA-binding MarR family transcriptional regulator
MGNNCLSKYYRKRMSPDTTPPTPPGDFYTAALGSPEQSAGYLIRKVMLSILAQADRELAPLGMTHAQWLPLYKLGMGTHDTLADLARGLQLDPGALTRSLDRLEAKGLIRRERSEADRRVVKLHLTAEGAAVARKVPPVLSGVLNHHLAGFTHAEWQQLLSLLSRMIANGERGPSASE